MSPISQLNLYGLEKDLDFLITLYKKGQLPNKLLFTGQKGIGKSTLAYHLINSVLSEGEDFSYNKKDFKINKNNKSYKLLLNGTNPNFELIDITSNSQTIKIDQIRNLIFNINMSSFNDKPRFVLIDNTEYLNKNSINALLKDLEEPNDDIYFILINNQKKLLKTLTSRCLNFNITLSYSKSLKVINNLLDKDIYDLINSDLLYHYITPGNFVRLYNFAKKNDLDLKKYNLKEFINKIIDNDYLKKETSLKHIFYDFIELFLKNTSIIVNMNYYNYFINKFNELKKFNLDEESLFIEFKDKILNG